MYIASQFIQDIADLKQKIAELKPKSDILKKASRLFKKPLLLEFYDLLKLVHKKIQELEEADDFEIFFQRNITPENLAHIPELLFVKRIFKEGLEITEESTFIICFYSLQLLVRWSEGDYKSDHPQDFFKTIEKNTKYKKALESLIAKLKLAMESYLGEHQIPKSIHNLIMAYFTNANAILNLVDHQKNFNIYDPKKDDICQQLNENKNQETVSLLIQSITQKITKVSTIPGDPPLPIAAIQTKMAAIKAQTPVYIYLLQAKAARIVVWENGIGTLYREGLTSIQQRDRVNGKTLYTLGKLLAWQFFFSQQQLLITYEIATQRLLSQDGLTLEEIQMLLEQMSCPPTLEAAAETIAEDYLNHHFGHFHFDNRGIISGITEGLTEVQSHLQVLKNKCAIYYETVGGKIKNEFEKRIADLNDHIVAAQTPTELETAHSALSVLHRISTNSPTILDSVRPQLKVCQTDLNRKFKIFVSHNNPLQQELTILRELNEAENLQKEMEAYIEISTQEIEVLSKEKEQLENQLCTIAKNRALQMDIFVELEDIIAKSHCQIRPFLNKPENKKHFSPELWTDLQKALDFLLKNNNHAEHLLPFIKNAHGWLTQEKSKEAEPIEQKIKDATLKIESKKNTQAALVNKKEKTGRAISELKETLVVRLHRHLVTLQATFQAQARQFHRCKPDFGTNIELGDLKKQLMLSIQHWHSQIQSHIELRTNEKNRLDVFQQHLSLFLAKFPQCDPNFSLMQRTVKQIETLEKTLALNANQYLQLNFDTEIVLANNLDSIYRHGQQQKKLIDLIDPSTSTQLIEELKTIRAEESKIDLSAVTLFAFKNNSSITELDSRFGAYVTLIQQQSEEIRHAAQDKKAAILTRLQEQFRQCFKKLDPPITSSPLYTILLDHNNDFFSTELLLQILKDISLIQNTQQLNSTHFNYHLKQLALQAVELILPHCNNGDDLKVLQTELKKYAEGKHCLDYLRLQRTPFRLFGLISYGNTKTWCAINNKISNQIKKIMPEEKISLKQRSCW